MIKQEDKPELSYLRQQTLAWLKRILLVIIAFSFTYIVLELGSSPKPEASFDDSHAATPMPIEDIPLIEETPPLTYTEVSMIDDMLVEETFELDVNIINGDQFNADLIESRLNPSVEQISSLAEETQVELYPNANSIFEAPEKVEVVEDVEPEQTPDEIEATYEEELPEGEYTEEAEMTPEEEAEASKNGYYVYRGHKKLSDIELDIRHKPPYFGPNPVIAIVIDDMGISPQRTKDIISIAAPITSSFLTYSNNLLPQIKQAQNAGHEILIHVPMQAKSNVDEAPDVLKIDMETQDIKAKFESMLKKFDKSDIKGINNHMGSLFTEHGEKLAPVMEVLEKENLFFLDSKTSAKSQGRQAAEEHHVPYVHRHVFLDNVNDVEYITKQLHLTENVARRNGYAVAIGHPKSGTYRALQDWVSTLEDKNLKVVHLSEIVKALNPQGEE